ncbi:hypothetical protein D3C80_699630 [compost metagenome]
MVDVQMGKKDVVDRLERHLHGEDIAHAAGAEIEEEALAIAQLDHDASARLAAGRWHWRTAEEGNAHLILAQFLGTGEVVVVIVQIRRRTVVRREGDASARATTVGVTLHGGRRGVGCTGLRAWGGIVGGCTAPERKTGDPGHCHTECLQRITPRGVAVSLFAALRQLLLVIHLCISSLARDMYAAVAPREVSAQYVSK